MEKPFVIHALQKLFLYQSSGSTGMSGFVRDVMLSAVQVMSNPTFFRKRNSLKNDFSVPDEDDEELRLALKLSLEESQRNSKPYSSSNFEVSRYFLDEKK